MIDEKIVKHVANLARLEIKEADISKLSNQLSKIIQYVETINELDLQGVKPTSHAVGVSNVFRADEVVHTKVRDKLLEQAPESEGGFFRVPKVL